LFSVASHFAHITQIFVPSHSGVKVTVT